MRAVLDRADFESALRWHSAGSPLRLLHLVVAAQQVTIESCFDGGWRQTVLETKTPEGALGPLDTQDGEARFSVARVLEQMRVSKSAEVTVERIDKEVRTTLGRSRSASPTIPEIASWTGPNEPIEDVAEADSDDLLWAFRAAAAAAAKPNQNAAEALKAARVMIKDSSITMHATDTYRLASARIDCMTSLEREYLVNAAAFVTAVGAMDNPVRLIDSGGRLGLRGSRNTILLSALAEQPRNITSVLAKAATYHEGVEVPTADIAAALTGVGSGRGGQVEVCFHKEHVAVRNAVSTEVMAGQTVAEVEGTVDPTMQGHMFTVNSANFHEVLRAIRSQRVRLCTARSSRAPLVVTEAPDKQEEATLLSATYIGFVALINR